MIARVMITSKEEYYMANSTHHFQQFLNVAIGTGQLLYPPRITEHFRIVSCSWTVALLLVVVDAVLFMQSYTNPHPF